MFDCISTDFYSQPGLVASGEFVLVESKCGFSPALLERLGVARDTGRRASQARRDGSQEPGMLHALGLTHRLMVCAVGHLDEQPTLSLSHTGMRLQPPFRCCAGLSRQLPYHGNNVLSPAPRKCANLRPHMGVLEAVPNPQQLRRALDAHADPARKVDAYGSIANHQDWTCTLRRA